MATLRCELVIFFMLRNIVGIKTTLSILDKSSTILRNVVGRSTLCFFLIGILFSERRLEWEEISTL